MHIDLTLDEDAEKIVITYDDTFTLTSEVNTKGVIVHRGYDDVEDESIADILQNTSTAFLKNLSQ